MLAFLSEVQKGVFVRPIVPSYVLVESSLRSSYERKRRKGPRAGRFLDRRGFPLDQSRDASTSYGEHDLELFMRVFYGITLIDCPESLNDAGGVAFCCKPSHPCEYFAGWSCHL